MSRVTRTCLLAVLAACAAPRPAAVGEATLASRALPLVSIREFEAPVRLRPCCAFGYGLSVQMAGVPVPGVRVQNLVDASDLGPHTYNGGLVSSRNDPWTGFVSREGNGLVYTCRGGFVDVAHVRDYADWTAYLARWLEETLDEGGALRLPDEAGRRQVYVIALDRAQIAAMGRRELSVHLAQWLAFQVSVWHEVATWFGWSSIGLFPELASAFSPEDLYSNLLGIHLGGAIVRAGGAATEAEFNARMQRALARALDALGAMPPEVGRLAADAVDGTWWDSARRLPDKALVRRRYLSLGPVWLPWRVPVERQPGKLRSALDAHCGGSLRDALPLRLPHRAFGVDFADIARFEVRVDTAAMPVGFAFPDPTTGWISQEDLPALVEGIRFANRLEFGEHAARP